MFEKEEEKLTDYKMSYENIPVPLEAIDDAIFSGFQKAKLDEIRKPRRRKWMYSVAAAVILIAGFFTSVRFSPAFADYLTIIPGMEKIVELIRNDKGMMSAVENEYYQDLGVSSQQDGLEVTLDGAITDENGLVLFYTVQSDKNVSQLNLDAPRLKTKDGEAVQYSTASYNPTPIGEETTSQTGTIEFFFNEPLRGNEFILSFEVTGERQGNFSLPFTLEKQVMKKKVFDLNKTITIEGQEITVVSATIQPLRTAIHVKMDPNNTMKILDFQDIRLVDENGEVWNKISNGITASNISDDEKILYLQSNYFREPKELYIQFNKLQAIDKDDAYLIVDVENEKVIKQPKANIFSKVTVIEGNIGFYTDIVEEDFPYTLFSEVKDADGNTIEIGHTYSHGGSVDDIEDFGIYIPNLEKYKSPLSIEISFFPNWIEGNAKVKIE